jgi:translation initiation factor 2B subunit (eIF-2B alpha/beta/delta family)
MDLQSRRKQLADNLEKARKQHEDLGNGIQQIIGAITLIDEQLREEAEEQKDKSEQEAKPKAKDEKAKTGK